MFSSNLVINGATISADNRLFLTVQPQQPGAGPQLVEVKAGKPAPFPDAHWNGWQPGMDGADRFVGVNAIRAGPGGFLWVVDRGGPGIGKLLAPHGVKLVKIDLAKLLNRCSFRHLSRNRPLKLSTSPFCCGLPGAT